jgi:hypothetical protein
MPYLEEINDDAFTDLVTINLGKSLLETGCEGH